MQDDTAGHEIWRKRALSDTCLCHTPYRNRTRSIARSSCMLKNVET